MPQVDFDISLNLSDEEAIALADAFGCAVGDVEEKLKLYAPAALREYVDMFAGQALTGVSETRERRLVSILVALPPEEFPTDDRIARLFNLTSLQGRALLRATLSRNRNRLKEAMSAAARRFIAACQGPEGGDKEARCPNAVVIEMLNAQLSAANAPRAPIRRKIGTFDTYIIANGALNELKALYP